jgi:ribosome maturation factor RimP
LITREKIVEILEEAIAGSDTFIVDVIVTPSNHISVEVDKPEGISISECVEISKVIEGSLDRETEDFELEVASPGVGIPLKVRPQYEKNLGREVEVLFNTSIKIKGELKAVGDEGIQVEYLAKEKPEGAKRPKIVSKLEWFGWEQVKWTKVMVSFK